ncbi:hypothetical protein FNF28_00605 [Cafeteria roenbergensis]|uniref:Uncharacterized protein n=1 Tax=Cafeteria roenbergensis TaxID=33653 RepID=A0A5A8E1Q2_CAFRO|nr:hypothetical protein FNF28_00605 [Cafeteria roenbergensis]
MQRGGAQRGSDWEEKHRAFLERRRRATQQPAAAAQRRERAASPVQSPPRRTAAASVDQGVMQFSAHELARLRLRAGVSPTKGAGDTEGRSGAGGFPVRPRHEVHLSEADIPGLGGDASPRGGGGGGRAHGLPASGPHRGEVSTGRRHFGGATSSSRSHPGR